MGSNPAVPTVAKTRRLAVKTQVSGLFDVPAPIMQWISPDRPLRISGGFWEDPSTPALKWGRDVGGFSAD